VLRVCLVVFTLLAAAIESTAMVLTRRAVLSLLLSLPSAHAKAKDKGAENQALLPLTHITTDPLAVCNDGTRPGYFMSQATTQADQFNWLVYLQGGDWCYSQATCDQARDGCAKMLVGTDSAAAYPPSAHPLALRFLNAATLDARTGAEPASVRDSGETSTLVHAPLRKVTPHS